MKNTEHTNQSFYALYQNLIESRSWHIDKKYAMQMLNRLVAQTEMSKQEIAVDIRQRKAELIPKLIVKKGEGFNTVEKYDMNSSDTPFGSILELSLMGAMTVEGDWCSYGMYDFEKWIYEANQSSRIDGIFIRANTPGGEALAGQVLNNAILDSKKIVVVYTDLLASAGILGTLAADEIIASGEQTEIGSIGVYLNINKATVEYLKANIDAIYSEKSPNKNLGIREYMSGNPDFLVQEVTQSDTLFMDEYLKFRTLLGDAQQKQDTLSGHLYFANEALNRGLIDGIGTRQYALSRLQTLINNSKKNY